MNSFKKLQTGLQVTLAAVAVSLLASCSPTKSDTVSTNSSNTGLVFSATKTLTQCNRTADSNYTFNTAVAKNSAGAYVNDLLKIKFSYLSVAATAAGNTVRFYKWRINGTVSDLDSTPLNFYFYNLSTGATVTTATTSYNTSQISTTNGIYLQLNDPNEIYQVIKMVVYDSAGTVVSQVNSLIPSFYVSPVDYQLNADGTARAAILQSLHPLASQLTAGYATAQYAASTSAFCF